MKSYGRVKKRYVTQVTKWLHNFNITLLQHISNFITIKIKEAGRGATRGARDGGHGGARDGEARGGSREVGHRNSISRVNQRRLPKL